jgi:ABC-type phosphate/phosphonate transport system substrate-binding protein
LGSLIVLACIAVAPARAQKGNDYLLRIGATSTLTGKANDSKEKTGQELLHQFIKEETGLNNEVTGQEKWESLAEKLAKGQTQLGVFQGYEFAWAQDRYPQLKPLALGVNVYTFPAACVMVKRDNPATDFGALKGQTLASPVTAKGFLKLFIQRQPAMRGKSEDAYFSKVIPAENVEDALDDVVDGKVAAIVVEQTASDAFKRRKPGRFKQLKEIARSQPFPPVTVAYFGTTLDPGTLQRFRASLLKASTKEKGEMLLTLGQLTGFVAVPPDFEQVVAQTRKSYPYEPSK